MLPILVFLACKEDTENTNEDLKDSIQEKIDSTEAIYNDESYQEALSLQRKIQNSVSADIETVPTPALEGDDAADDPAIWIHPADPAMSTVIGTNKKSGLYVYDLEGKELYGYQIGKVNNVDVRYNFKIGNELVDLVACSNRTLNGLTIMKINRETRALEEILIREIKIDTTELNDVYGFCFYQSKQSDKLFAFINGKNGNIQQWEVFAAKDSKVDVKLVRKFNVNSQPEGMVADDENALLYVGEEGHGLWKFDAEPSGNDDRELIFHVDSIQDAVRDIEGVSIYYAAEGEGYIIVSSQGNFAYLIFDRKTGKYVGSFKVIEDQIDGIEETDGLDVINIPMGDKFPNGFFIAQDGFNNDKGKPNLQNFKLVAWEKIAQAFEPNLIIDNSYKAYSNK